MKRQKMQAEAASTVETESADVTEAKTFEVVTTSLVIDVNGIAQVATGVGHLFVAAHLGIAWVGGESSKIHGDLLPSLGARSRSSLLERRLAGFPKRRPPWTSWLQKML